MVRISTIYGRDDGPVDWKSLKRDILDRLAIADEYAALGVQFTGHVRITGWRECRAFGRTDRNPSAAVNVKTGFYRSHGEGAEVLGFFDFALKYGPWTEWVEVVEHYADKAGVPMPTAPTDRQGKALEAIYPYLSSAGDLLYEVLRFRESGGKKTFRIRRPEGDDYAWNLGDVEPVPYNLPGIVHSDPGEPVYVVEGEKDADRLVEGGLQATCNHGGTGQSGLWLKFAPHLANRDCFVVPDCDQSGREHARKVCEAIYPHARMVKVVDLTGLPDKGDVSDWLDLDHTIDDLRTLAGKAIAWTPEAGEEDAELDRDATAADLIRLNARISWIWQGWIARGVLNVLASEPGIGKTRLCLDLARRVALGLPWPDGTPQTLPAGSPTLWIPADNQHSELASLPEQFGFAPDLLYLNATARNPFVGTMLDSDEDLREFEARIHRVKPALVFVDTTANATDRSQHKPEDAKAFFKPLQEIAKRTGIAFVLVTHLNAAGKPLGRRIEGQARIVQMLESPDPDGQPNRRKYYIRKTFDLMPPPLGVTLHERGNDYDDAPPEPVEEGRGAGREGNGGRDSKVGKCQEWLYQLLDGRGSVPVHEVRDLATDEGYSTSTLYQARDKLGINEFPLNGKKYWQLQPDEDGPIE